jgi:hypothetical protein
MKTIRHHTVRNGLRFVAAVALGAALTTGVASAECSEKARALGKCPQAHAMPKAKTSVHAAGTSPISAGAPKTLTKNHGVPGVGPSPIQHSDKNALNPQPIPPGRPLHPLPPVSDEAGGH